MWKVAVLVFWEGKYSTSGGAGLYTLWPKVRNAGQYCSFTVGDYKGTFLQEVHVPPWELVRFVNHWLRKKWDHSSVWKFPRRTSVDWRSFCSEVTEHWFANQESIGGPEITVEIGETLIVKKVQQRPCFGPGLAIWGDSENQEFVPLVVERPVQEARQSHWH